MTGPQPVPDVLQALDFQPTCMGRYTSGPCTDPATWRALTCHASGVFCARCMGVMLLIEVPTTCPACGARFATYAAAIRRVVPL